MIRFIPNPAAKGQMRAALLQAVTEVFELDIKPEAVKNSPVTPEGLARNLEQGKHGVLAQGTGHNRQSIDTEVKQTVKGPVATLFTQSGYGGYLEVGTGKMRAQPYLMPAMMKFLKTIPGRMKELLRG